MKIHRYGSGALLRIESGGVFGYADLRPWPEFGEKTLDAHLKDLTLPLVQRSLRFAKMDREFRARGVSAFAGLECPRGHLLVTDILRAPSLAGQTHVKVKMGRDLVAETQALRALSGDFLWRVDFNGRLSLDEFTQWWKQVPHDKIDFVEDPTDGDALQFAGPWADDWLEQPLAEIQIVKPARESAAEGYARVVFTHSMDHALGQACALWTAAKYYEAHPEKREVCGLGSLPTGTGFGFDEELAGLAWT